MNAEFAGRYVDQYVEVHDHTEAMRAQAARARLVREARSRQRQQRS